MKPAAADPLDQALDSLRRIDTLLDQELAALRQNDPNTLQRLAAEKSACLVPLSALLARLQRASLADTPKAAELRERLQNCQERNRANGMLMNVQASQRHKGIGALGLQQNGYGRYGTTSLRAGTRHIASA